MKYKLIARSRPDAGDDVCEKHGRFMAAVRELPSPLKPKRVDEPRVIDPGLQSLASVPLTKLLGLQSSVNYAGRWYLSDDAARDDWLSIAFNPEKIGFHELVHDCVKPLIAGFEAYLLTIEDERFTLKYFEQWRTKGYDDRDGVFMLGTVSYFDRELCRRAFALAPEKVCDRLKDVAEQVEVYREGALIILSSEPLPFEKAESLSLSARQCLPAGSRHERKPSRQPSQKVQTFGNLVSNLACGAIKRQIELDQRLADLLLDYSSESAKQVDRFLLGLRSRRDQFSNHEWGEILRWRSSYWQEMIQRQNAKQQI